MDKEKRGYELGKWSGLPKYMCVACAYDTLNLDDMLEHQVLQHSPLVQLEEPLVISDENQPAETDNGQVIYEIALEEVSDGTSNAD